LVVRRAGRPDRVVEDPAVAACVLARRPALLAPLEGHAEVEVAVLLAAGEGAEGLAGDANRRRAVDLHDGEDATRVDVQADRDAVGAAVRDPEPLVPNG